MLLCYFFWLQSLSIREKNRISFWKIVQKTTTMTTTYTSHIQSHSKNTFEALVCKRDSDLRGRCVSNCAFFYSLHIVIRIYLSLQRVWFFFRGKWSMHECKIIKPYGNEKKSGADCDIWDVLCCCWRCWSGFFSFIRSFRLFKLDTWTVLCLWAWACAQHAFKPHIIRGLLSHILNGNSENVRAWPSQGNSLVGLLDALSSSWSFYIVAFAANKIQTSIRTTFLAPFFACLTAHLIGFFYYIQKCRWPR